MKNIKNKNKNINKKTIIVSISAIAANQVQAKANGVLEQQHNDKSLVNFL